MTVDGLIPDTGHWLDDFKSGALAAAERAGGTGGRHICESLLEDAQGDGDVRYVCTTTLAVAAATPSQVIPTLVALAAKGLEGAIRRQGVLQLLTSPAWTWQTPAQWIQSLTDFRAWQADNEDSLVATGLPHNLFIGNGVLAEHLSCVYPTTPFKLKLVPEGVTINAEPLWLTKALVEDQHCWPPKIQTPPEVAPKFIAEGRPFDPDPRDYLPGGIRSLRKRVLTLRDRVFDVLLRALNSGTWGDHDKACIKWIFETFVAQELESIDSFEAAHKHQGHHIQIGGLRSLNHLVRMVGQEVSFRLTETIFPDTDGWLAPNGWGWYSCPISRAFMNLPLYPEVANSCHATSFEDTYRRLREILPKLEAFWQEYGIIWEQLAKTDLRENRPVKVSFIYEFDNLYQEIENYPEKMKRLIADLEENKAEEHRYMLFREGKHSWQIAFGGKAVYIKHCRGVSYVATLLEHPGQPIPYGEIEERCAGLPNQEFSAFSRAGSDLTKDADKIQGFSLNGEYEASRTHKKLDNKSIRDLVKIKKQLEGEIRSLNNCDFLNEDQEYSLCKHKEELSVIKFYLENNKYKEITAEAKKRRDRVQHNIKNFVKDIPRSLNDGKITCSDFLKKSIKCHLNEAVYLPSPGVDWHVRTG